VFQQRLSHRITNPRSNLQSLACGCTRQPQREFLSANPRREIAGAEYFVEYGSHMSQCCIPGRVPEPVIQGLEVIEVYAEN
jgi:hypothetical protein